jgi:hypothetical protein
MNSIPLHHKLIQHLPTTFDTGSISFRENSIDFVKKDDGWGKSTSERPQRLDILFTLTNILVEKGRGGNVEKSGTAT